MRYSSQNLGTRDIAEVSWLQISARQVVYSFCMPQTIDADILAAALVGYAEKINEIEARMAELRRELAGKPAPVAAPASAKRPVSAKSRRRMAAAQKKRWTAVRKAKAAAAEEARLAAAPKRVTKKRAASKPKPAVAPKNAARRKRQPVPVKQAAVKRPAAKTARIPKAAATPPQPESVPAPVVEQ